MRDQFRARQDRTEKGKEEMKNKIQGVQGMIKEIKDNAQRKIEEVESNVQRKITLLENNVQGKISILEKRIMDLEIRPNNFLECPDVMYARPTVKTLKFYGQTPWTV
ncbi:hypothetical protein AVEN_219541-1 [Araneus ventricosus]|uniref:Uncharacterized protein n=1 Tax=Araneus ventricosus TaxID=182803 RepID=A0A4Y2PW85_ARAVE|nr:hypothetical protein AVEN_131241-1 [Araneus ventricosus]GBN54841.1 hypothetical protein AVEN_219541-1 [Araneus ventricosus]